jgi:arylsulfatase A-like enzyme
MTPDIKKKYLQYFVKDLSGTLILPPGRKADNILLVIVEGLCGSVLPLLDTSQGVLPEITMPLLDSMARQNILFENYVVQQRQTNRGTFAILSGTPCKLNSSTPKMTEYVATSNDADSNSQQFLPGFLKAHGFETIYLQAAPLPYMLKDIFMKRAGFRNTYGTPWFKYSYSSNYWGVDDKAFFEQAFSLISSKKNQKKPWFITLLTVGTHHPINVPDTYGTPSQENSRVRAYRYLDESLRDFFNNLSKDGILKNTLVILTCDESQGIKERNDLPSMEKICQQWGVLIVFDPDMHQSMRIAEPFSASDLALSITDYCGLPAGSVPFLGRSIFRIYAASRDIYFGNTYGHITGRFTKDNFLDFCNVNFNYGERYTVDKNHLFSLNKRFVSKLNHDVLVDIARYSAISNSSILDPLVKSHSFDFHSTIVHPVKKGSEKNLLAGQYFIIPRNSFVSVTYSGRIIPGDSSVVFLKHDLAANGGKIRIVEYMHTDAVPGDTFFTQYSFYNNETCFYTEFRATAEVTKGDSACVIIDQASLQYTERPPTPEEKRKYIRPFDKSVGRILMTPLVIRRPQ